MKQEIKNLQTDQYPISDLPQDSIQCEAKLEPIDM